MSSGFKPRGRGGFRGGRSGFGKKRSSPDDEEEAPRSSKKAKAEDAEPLVQKLQKDEEGNDYVSLKANDLRRVTISDFKGNTLVSIREYWTNDAGEIKPGKKGIALPIDQYNAFVAALPLIESVLTKRGEKATRPDFDADPASTVPADDDEDAEEELGKEDEDEEE